MGLSFTDNVYGVDFADMQVLSKFDKENALKEKIQQLLTLFKNLKMNLNATQIKCGYIKTDNFVIDKYKYHG